MLRVVANAVRLQVTVDELVVLISLSIPWFGIIRNKMRVSLQAETEGRTSVESLSGVGIYKNLGT